MGNGAVAMLLRLLQYYDVTQFEFILWRHTMHAWVMNIHCQTWIAQGRFTNIIHTPWNNGMCGTNLLNLVKGASLPLGQSHDGSGVNEVILSTMGYTDITESTKRQQSKPKREQYTVVACAKFCSDKITCNAATYIQTIFFSEFELWWKNRSWNGPLVRFSLLRNHFSHIGTCFSIIYVLILVVVSSTVGILDVIAANIFLELIKLSRMICIRMDVIMRYAVALIV